MGTSAGACRALRVGSISLWLGAAHQLMAPPYAGGSASLSWWPSGWRRRQQRRRRAASLRLEGLQVLQVGGRLRQGPMPWSLGPSGSGPAPASWAGAHSRRRRRLACATGWGCHGVWRGSLSWQRAPLLVAVAWEMLGHLLRVARARATGGGCAVGELCQKGSGP